MDQGLVWFENLSQELARNPKAASQQYETFKNSEQVLQNCRLILLASQTSPLAKFYALSAAQYALLMRWESLSPTVPGEWIIYLEDLILLVAQQWQQLPVFLTRKVLFLYVSLLKRGWLSVDNSQRIKLLHLIAYLLEKENIAENQAGGQLLLCVLEEFRSLSYYDYNYMLKAFNPVKIHFEKHALYQVFEIAFPALHKRVSSLTFYPSATPPFLTLLTSLLKSVNLIITWEYGEISQIKLGNSEEGGGLMLYSPLSSFHSLLSPDFYLLFYSLYSYLRSVQTKEELREEAEEILREIKQVLLHLSLFSGEVYGGGEKTLFLSSFLSPLLSLVQPHIERRTLQLLTLECADYDAEHNVRYEELSLFLSLLHHLLFNHSLSTLVHLSVFPTLLSSLVQISLSINNEVNTLVQDMLLLYTRSLFTYQQDSNIWSENWRGEVLSSLLDLWVLLFDQYELLVEEERESRGGMGGIEGGNVGGPGGMGGMGGVKEYFVNFTAEFFPTLCNNMVGICVNTCLQSSAQESSEEREQIYEEEVEERVRLIGRMGRVTLSQSLSILSSSLVSFLSQYSGSKNISEVVYCLESMRLCLLLLSSLLVESQESESPSLSSHLLESLSSHETIHILFSTLQQVVVVLQTQVSYLTLEKEKASPSILEEIYSLFTCLLNRYIDPLLSSYSPDTQAKHAILFSVLQDERWSALLTVLVEAFVPMLQFFPLEPSLLGKACQFLSALVKTSNPLRIRYLQQLSLLQQFYMLYVFSAPTSVFHLSCDSAATITETILNICVTLQNASQFEQILRSVYESLQVFHADKASNSTLNTMRSLSVYLLTAMCKVKYEHQSLNNVIFPIYKHFFSLLFSPYHSNQSVLTYYMECYEDVLNSLVVFTHSFVLHLLAHCDEEVSQLLYQLIIHIFAHYHNRLKRGKEDEVVEKVILLLEILQDLSLKEFILMDIYKTNNFQSTFMRTFISHTQSYYKEQQNNALPVIILYNFTLLFPSITIKLLYTYEKLADKYTSLLLYVFSSFISYIIPQYICSLSLLQYQELVYVILACTLHTNSSIAREALQALQQLASYQIELLHSAKHANNSLRLPGDYMMIYREILRYILKVLLCPQHLTAQYSQTLDKDISQNLKADLVSDRFDAFANTFICYIVLNCTTALQQDVVSILTQEMGLQASHSSYPQYLQLFGKLITDREVRLEGGTGEVVCSYIQKKNRMLFVMNFREFIVQIKALNAAHQ